MGNGKWARKIAGEEKNNKGRKQARDMGNVRLVCPGAVGYSSVLVCRRLVVG